MDDGRGSTPRMVEQDRNAVGVSKTKLPLSSIGDLNVGQDRQIDRGRLKVGLDDESIAAVNLATGDESGLVDARRGRESGAIFAHPLGIVPHRAAEVQRSVG